MKKILVLYYSRNGTTAAMAAEIAKGVESVPACEAILRTVPTVSPSVEASEPAIPATGDVYATSEDLEQCDGLVLGSPTRFGTIASPLKYYFDQSVPQWLSGALKDKPAAVFTSTSSPHGGQESTLLGMMLPLLHHGMILVGLPFSGTAIGHAKAGGSPYGASHQAAEISPGRPTNEESGFCATLGRRVANVATQLNNKPL